MKQKSWNFIWLDLDVLFHRTGETGCLNEPPNVKKYICASLTRTRVSVLKTAPPQRCVTHELPESYHEYGIKNALDFIFLFDEIWGVFAFWDV